MRVNLVAQSVWKREILENEEMNMELYMCEGNELACLVDTKLVWRYRLAIVEHDIFEVALLKFIGAGDEIDKSDRVHYILSKHYHSTWQDTIAWTQLLKAYWNRGLILT